MLVSVGASYLTQQLPTIVIDVILALDFLSVVLSALEDDWIMEETGCPVLPMLCLIPTGKQ